MSASLLCFPGILEHPIRFINFTKIKDQHRYGRGKFNCRWVSSQPSSTFSLRLLRIKLNIRQTTHVGPMCLLFLNQSGQRNFDFSSLILAFFSLSLALFGGHSSGRLFERQQQCLQALLCRCTATSGTAKLGRQPLRPSAFGPDT